MYLCVCGNGDVLWMPSLTHKVISSPKATVIGALALESPTVYDMI